MTKYSKGTRYEYEIKHYLESKGWFVIRAAGSHGKADLAAIKKGESPLLIQCKNGRYDPREEVEFTKFCLDLNAHCYFAVRSRDWKEKLDAWLASVINGGN